VASEEFAPAIPSGLAHPQLIPREQAAVASTHADPIDALYLLACQVEWERRGDPSSAWEVLAAANAGDEETRAHARSLLASSRRIDSEFHESASTENHHPRIVSPEASMKTPYGLEIVESCVGCKLSRNHFFCAFSPTVLRSMDVASHHSILPSGAILFVEGQTPRGIYILCSGKVKLYTTSKEGKVLILKQAEAGEVLGLSAAVSGMNYEMTAETATPCQLNYVSRTDLMSLLQCESEVGVHAAQWLSRDFQAAYRDIRDLVLSRSSAGKLARLLLSCAPGQNHQQQSPEFRLRSPMTHEEMAQRIGSSRETVTRLLSELKKKRLIRLEGATLVIRDRPGLESLAV
jgi:CRP/FNR family transcriptional regulator